MVIHDLAAHFGRNELIRNDSLPPPTILRTNQGACIQAIGSHLILEIAASHHVRARPGPIAHLSFAGDRAAAHKNSVNSSEPRKYSLDARVVAKHELFAIEEDEVDAPIRVKVAEMMSHFHQDSDAGTRVVGSDEGEVVPFGQHFFVGVRTCVVVGTNHNPTVNLWFP